MIWQPTLTLLYRRSRLRLLSKVTAHSMSKNVHTSPKPVNPPVPAERFCAVALIALFAPLADGQSGKPVRMEILLEKEDRGKAVLMEPGHVFESGDRLRFRFTANLDRKSTRLNSSH